MNIKKVIRDKGWTLERLAAEMKNKKGEKGVTHAAVSQIINGNPTIDKIQEIAGIIGITASELIADDESEHSVRCPKCGYEMKIKIE